MAGLIDAGKWYVDVLNVEELVSKTEHMKRAFSTTQSNTKTCHQKEQY